MSGNNYSDYRSRGIAYSGFASSDERERKKAEKLRAERVEKAKETVHEKSTKARPKREDNAVYDDKLVRLGITKPKPGVKRVYVIYIDNSGSNRVIAAHLRKSSAWLLSLLKMLDPEAQIAFVYFSDHTDGSQFTQEVDFVSPDEEGDKIMFSTISHISAANGFDVPEAHECALKAACEINFGGAVEKHLIMISDVVGHGMGMPFDDGCPAQQSWKKSVELVAKTYDTFHFIGCGDDAEVCELQQQFISDPKRVPWDLIDLSMVKDEQHRMRITGNAIMFLIARQLGRQAMEMFLGFLYEKWLDDPIFGEATDARAQEMIRRFTKYLEWPETEIEDMLKKVFVQ
ncbi:MAG: hypothetical protein WC310_05170 [Patescibacteria group bacterium]|jgi:hypothetical protein